MQKKIIIGLKIKIKNRERGKKTSSELQKPSIEAEVYNNNKICDWGKKSSKAQLDFIVPIKSTTTMVVGGRGGKKEKKNPKESAGQVKT